MLNPFPQLLDFSFAAPLLVRVAVAVVFLHVCYPTVLFFLPHKKTLPSPPRVWSVAVAVGSLVLIVGLYVQIASLVLCTATAIALVFKKHLAVPLCTDTRLLVLLFVLSLSLLFSGAGLFAFDVPL